MRVSHGTPLGERKKSSVDLTRLAKPTATPMTAPHTTALDARLLACFAGAYPWDDWERSALASGLAADLATLGRAVMREACQHGWCQRLKAECGLHDEGRAMLRGVLAHPRRTAARWQWLMATDGLRFDPWDHREFYEDSPCWNALRARWDREWAKLAAVPVTSSFLLHPSNF